MTWVWWLVNRIRQWQEDRNVSECSYLSQMRNLWTRREPCKVVTFKVEQRDPRVQRRIA